MSNRLTKKYGGAKTKKRSSTKKNLFFKKMLSAKKKGDKSFKYKGKTYRRHKKGALIYYKAK